MRGNSRKYRIKSRYDNILTWANQTRILAQSFEQLGSVIGGTLINAFKPLVAWLNRAMQSIIAFAQTVANALGKIFGWTYEIKGGGIANDFEDAGAGAEDMADGTGKAKDNLKEMQKYIAAWHEVNNMTTKDDDEGGGKGGGGGAGGALGGAAGGQFVRTEGLLDKYKSDIDSLYELGDYIGKVLTKAMNGIDWESVYQGARNFGKGLANFLNGLISPELFGATGRTIAGALNTAIYAALSFGERFDWKDFGLSIATGINEFFKTFDFASLAKTINVWANGILDAIITAIDATDWGMIGTRIGTFLEKIDFLKILRKIGKAIWKALNAGFEMYQKTFETAPLETALVTLVGVTKLLKVAKFQALINIFSKGFTIAGKFFEALAGGSSIISALLMQFPKLGSAVNTVTTSFLFFVNGFKNGGILQGLSAGFANISQNLTAVQKGFIGITAAFAEFAIFKNVTRDMALGTENIVAGLVKLAATAGIAGVALSAVFSFPVGAIAAGIIGLTGLLVGMNEAQNELAENSSIGQFSNSIDELSENVSRKTEEIRENLSGIKDNIESSGSAQSQMARDLAAEYGELADKSSLSVNEQIRMKEITEQLSGIVPGLSDYINDQTGLLEIQKDTLDDLIENMDLYARKQAAEEMLTEAYKAQYEAQRNVQKAEEGLKDAREEFISGSEGMSDAVKNMVRDGDIKGLYELANAINDGTSEFSSFEEAFGKGVKKFSTAQKVISNLRESMVGYEEALGEANDALLDAGKAVDFANGAWSESNRAITENEKRMLEAKKATAEYKQTLHDISSDLSQFGVTFSEEFKEKLALDDTGMADSVVEAFDKMKNQTKLSSAELQQLFGNIAPGMSAAFIEALANQDPAIQLQVAATMANIASGAQASEDDVKLIFSSIGYDLPQEAINAFASQGSVVQSSVIDFMSHISNGGTLASESLYTLFRGFGINLPTSMIEEMEGMNEQAQQTAINLLLQLAAGCDMSKDEIISAFVDIGMRIPEGLQNAIENGNVETYLTSQNLLQQLSNAANASEMSRIIKEYNDFGDGVISNGLVAALNSKDETVKDEATGLINQVTSAATGKDRDTAIAALNKFVDDFVDKGFIGPIYNKEQTVKKNSSILAGWWTEGFQNTINSAQIDSSPMLDKAYQTGYDSGQFGSPSKLTEQLGKWWAEGFNIGFTNSIPDTLSAISTWATETYNLFSENINKTITDVTTWFSELPEKIYAAILLTIERITAWGGQTFQTFQTNVNNSIAGVVNWFSQMPGKIYTAISKFITQTLPKWKDKIDSFFGGAIPKIISNVVRLFGNIGKSLVPIGENIIRGLWEGISNLTGWIGEKIGGFCNRILDKFKSGFDEHSPSKEAFRIGDYFTIGLGNGLVSRFSDVYGDVESFTEKISSIQIEPPVLDYTIPVVEEYSRQYSDADMGRLKNTLQMEMDEKMAQMAYENRQLKDAVERNTQILEKILSQGVVLDDNNFTDRYKRAASKFMDRNHYEMGLYPAGR